MEWAKEVHRGQFIALNTYIRKEKSFKSSESSIKIGGKKKPKSMEGKNKDEQRFSN